jgi:hypothetical protein
MYFEVQLEILSFMFLVSTCTHFLVLFGLMMAQFGVETDRYLIKITIKMCSL